MSSYYKDEYRKTHNDGLSVTPEERFQFQAFKSKRIATAVRDLVPEGGSILDIGCSAGGLLGHLVDDYECFGSEWNPEDAAFVRDSGVACEEGSLTDIYPDKKFTAITAIDVLEHQTDPIQFLKNVRERLIGGGYLYMELPNIDDALVSLYDIPEFKEYWYRQPHITYWNAQTLSSVMTWLGFEARLDWIQRYGLANHMHWLLERTPMKDPYAARDLIKPVPKSHSASSALNRIWTHLDHEYRIQLRSNLMSDTITVRARLTQI
jgi:2-polyprenyl-3-methyl-5-hydroxy-6-metoxy-1,4-benzoquinol methylase